MRLHASCVYTVFTKWINKCNKINDKKLLQERRFDINKKIRLNKMCLAEWNKTSREKGIIGSYIHILVGNRLNNSYVYIYVVQPQIILIVYYIFFFIYFVFNNLSILCFCFLFPIKCSLLHLWVLCGLYIL